MNITREEQSRLIIISGPSGTGKSSIIKKLLRKHPQDISFSISTTTRKKRPNEKDGVHYYFVTHEQFEKEREKNAFVEWASVHNNYYATSIKEVLRIVRAGQYCILDIDVQGTVAISEIYPFTKRIFILPPSIKVLEQRLIKRGDTTEDDINLRLQNTVQELSYIHFYQYFIVNYSIASSIRQIEKIIYDAP